MPRKSDFLIGVESGSEFAGQILRDRLEREGAIESRRRWQQEQGQQDQRHRDVIEQRREALALSKDESHLRKKQIEADLEFQRAENELRVSKRDNAARQRRALIELEMGANFLMAKPTTENTMAEMIELWSDKLDLTHSEDEMVRESAGLLRQRMEKFWQSSQGFKKLQAIAAAEADGFIKPGDRTDQGRVASGLADHQYTQLKTDAASKGVDFENEVAARVSGGHETGPDGLAPVSLARLRHAIEAEAEIKRRAVPDGKIRLPLTFIERDGEKIPVGSYEAKGDVLRDATVRALLEKQGVDMTPTPTDADEYNRLPAGARYRHPDGSIRVKQGVDMNPPKPAPARPADRKAGEVYQTPKGIYRWNGSGWETP